MAALITLASSWGEAEFGAGAPDSGAAGIAASIMRQIPDMPRIMPTSKVKRMNTTLMPMAVTFKPSCSNEGILKFREGARL